MRRAVRSWRGAASALTPLNRSLCLHSRVLPHCRFGFCHAAPAASSLLARPSCTRAPSATATPLRFVDRAHVLLSDGWVVRAASHRVLTDAASPLLAAPNATAKKQRDTVSRSKLGARRGEQRWSALVSAPTSRLAKTMRARLGDAHWLAFVRHANRHYKAAYVRAFEQRILRCAGPICGGACPHAFEVDLDARDATLEHERPVRGVERATTGQSARVGRRDRRRRAVSRALRRARRRGAWCALSALPVRSAPRSALRAPRVLSRLVDAYCHDGSAAWFFGGGGASVRSGWCSKAV